MHAGVRAYLRPETVVVVPFVAVFVVGLVSGLPLVLPDVDSLALIQRYYFRPLVLVVLALGFSIWGAQRLRPMQGRYSGLAWSLGTVCIALIVHFNFKVWMPLVNHSLFDRELAMTDEMFGGLVPALIQLRRAIAAVLSGWGVNVDLAYHQLFLLLFFVSTGAHALLDTPRGLRHIVLSVSLILLLGGCLYWVMPAKGPFVFRGVESTAARVTEQTMERLFDQFVATRTVPKGYLVVPLAAMPSLHMAHSLLFCLYAWRRFRLLLIIFLPSLAWIFVEAVAAGWHYLLDLGAGSVLAVVVLRVVDGLFAWHEGEAKALAPAAETPVPLVDWQVGTQSRP